MKRLVPQRFHWLHDFLDRNGAITAFLIVLAISIFGLYQLRVQNDRTQKAAEQSARALCNIRNTYAQSIRSTREFLKDHPKGIPGIPNSVLLKGIADNQKRIKALSDVDCPPDF